MHALERDGRMKHPADQVEGLVRDNRVEVRVLFGAPQGSPAPAGFSRSPWPSFGTGWPLDLDSECGRGSLALQGRDEAAAERGDAALSLLAVADRLTGLRIEDLLEVVVLDDVRAARLPVAGIDTAGSPERISRSTGPLARSMLSDSASWAMRSAYVGVEQTTLESVLTHARRALA
jgi:hypothetical protein